ncbi:hypothetical protein FACS189444_5640 [Spirochaetia bacterium]|nr:hypothetical protein FACS189444_5640 [Spirochaetia bacterium]
MKKRFTMMGLAALTAAALLLSACNPAFEPSGDDFKGDWNSALARADSDDGARWLQVRTNDGIVASPSITWGSKAEITIVFTNSVSSTAAPADAKHSFSLDKAGIENAVKIRPVTALPVTSTATAVSPSSKVGDPIPAAKITVLHLEDTSVTLQVDLTGYAYSKLRLDIDASVALSTQGHKLNLDYDLNPGEPEDNYYLGISVTQNSSTLPAAWTFDHTGSVALPNPRGTTSITSQNFEKADKAGESGLVNRIVLSTGYDSLFSTYDTDKAGIKTFLDSNVIVEKYDGGWKEVSRNAFAYNDTTYTSGTGKWTATLTGVVEGDILRARVKNRTKDAYASTATYYDYPVHFTTKNNDPTEVILADAARYLKDTGDSRKSGYIGSSSVFNDGTSIGVESYDRKNYRIVIPVDIGSIGYKGLSTYDQPGWFKVVKFSGTYPVYVNVTKVSTRTSTTVISGTEFHAVTHIVLDIDNNTLGDGDGDGDGITTDWKVLVSPLAKTADHTEIATGGNAAFISRNIADTSGFYTKDAYYGWSSLNGNGSSL